MKITLFILLTLFMLILSVNSLYAQTYTNDCSASAITERTYKNDVYRLATARVFEINSPFKDSVDIPQTFQDSIAKALYALDNMTWSPLKDTILNLFGFRNFETGGSPSYEGDSSHAHNVDQTQTYSCKVLNIRIQPGAAWAPDWAAGNYGNTNNPGINALVNRYQLNIVFLGTALGISNYYAYTPKALNTAALANKFNLITGVINAEAFPFNGDGNTIKAKFEQDGILLTYRNGCGDCPLGCTRSRSWMFKVFTHTDCRVQFMGAVNQGISPFNPFVCTRGNVLPVTFNKLQASIKNNQPIVQWRVVTESGIEKYIIESSADGVRFDEAGSVLAKGNPTNSLLYEWLDERNLPGGRNIYYRVKAIDRSGVILYTNVVKLVLGSTDLISVFPNPVVQKKLHIRFRTWGNYTLQLYGSDGKKVFQKNISSGDFIVSLPFSIRSGLYQLIIRGSQALFSETLMIQ